VTLSPKLYDLLCLLVREQGRVVPRIRVIEALRPGGVVSDTNLRQKVFLLRGALSAADPTGGEYVATVPRLGYRLAATVTSGPVPAPPPVAVPLFRAGSTPVGRRLPAGLWGLPLLLAVFVCSPHETRMLRATRAAAAVDGRSVTLLRFMSHPSQDQDGWLASAFTEMLHAELAAAERLRLLPVETVERVAAELSPPPSLDFSADRLAWVRRALGTDLVVAGSLVAAGPGPDAQLSVHLLIHCARTRRVLASVTHRGRRHDLPGLASGTAREVLRSLTAQAHPVAGGAASR
jgi:hypothetical protein